MPAGKAGEGRAFQSPGHYIQGPGEIRNLPVFAADFGSTALLLIDTFFYKTYSRTLPALFEEKGMTAYTIEYSGMATDALAEELIEACRRLPSEPDVFIGIGGGQACDMNKVLGHAFHKAFISVPTALTTDAPTSSHAMINNPGEQPRVTPCGKNPDYVVVDTEITIQSPEWMLISGIGDALATYIEALTSFANYNVCNAGGGHYRPTLLGLAVAKTCYDTLLEKGREAMLAARHHIRTPAYEDVVEATVLLSGVGFECTGTSIAHGLSAGFHAVPIHMLHGTSVGYCTLIQLIVQNETAHFEEIFRFCKDIGLPVCTAQLGIAPEKRKESVEKMVDDVYGKRWVVMNTPFFYSRETLINAIYYLDAYAAEH